MNTNFSNPGRHDTGDPYGDYAEWFDPEVRETQQLLSRRPKSNRQPKKSQKEVLETLVDETSGLEGGFQTTYTPGEQEAEWLYSSLTPFFELELIHDVLGQIKGGKEASVYRCVGHQDGEERLLAAKIYRPRKHRQLRNDALYREGRTIIEGDGGRVERIDRRMARAIVKRTAFGEEVRHTSWLMHEFTTMERLHAEGASVPQPIAAGENAILMQYVGGSGLAAPTLHEVRLEDDEVGPIFQEILRNIRLMLRFGLIHGDLSAFNILYWQGKIYLIDFPQVIESHVNRQAREILSRDVRRVCQYFDQYGLNSRPEAITAQLWDAYAALDPDDLAADLSVFMAAQEELAAEKENSR